MSARREKGTKWESAIVAYLREWGRPHAERMPLTGSQDRGDIAGIPGVVIEAKNHAALDLAGWVDEAERERDNASASVGVAWAHRRGRLSPGDGYVIMTGAQFLGLLREAGY